MLQPSPSTSEYSIKVVWGRVSPTLIMFLLLEMKNDPRLWVICSKPFGSLGLRLKPLVPFQPGELPPSFWFRDGTAFCDFNHVAQVVLTSFVMRVVFAGLAHDLAVERMLDATLHQHGDCFGHVWRLDHFANESAFE